MNNTDENTRLLETLVDRATEFGKTSFEIVKLKTLDKISDLVSSLIPLSIVVILFFIFLLFLNLGIALWLGEIMGKIFYGFFAVSAFYILAGIIIHFVLHKPIKRVVGDYVIRHLLK